MLSGSLPNQQAQTANHPDTPKEEKEQQVAWFAFNLISIINLNSFILDSGATEHLVRADLETFMKNVIQLEEEVTIQTANDGKMIAKKRGDLLTRCQGVNIKINALLVSGI